MKDQDNDKPVDKNHVAAIEALTLFASQFEPAAMLNADTFYTTNEISQAIQDHTGFNLEAHEIYEVMSHMQYKYKALNGLEFNWLLRKE